MRPIEEDEYESFLSATETAFASELHREDIDRFRTLLERDRTLAVLDAGHIVGTAGAFTFTLSVPGGELPAGGVTIVGVLPSHTRRGILTRLMRHQLEDIHRRGEPLAVLWASEGAIYQRFGYGLGARHASIRIDREGTRFRETTERRGTISLVTPAEAPKQLDPIYERARSETPGMFARSTEWWEKHRLSDYEFERDGGGPLFCALLEIDGEGRGYALYRVRQSWHEGWPQGRLLVREAISTDPVATRELWRFLFSVDLVGRVEAWVPIDHPLSVMLQEPRRLRMTVNDSLWLRIVDLSGALEGRSYDADGSVVLELSDPICEWNSGRWELTVTDGRGTLQRSEEDPGLVLEPWDLGSVYLGGHTFAELQRAGRLSGSDPEAIAAADRMFRTARAPWCPEIF